MDSVFLNFLIYPPNCNLDPLTRSNLMWDTLYLIIYLLCMVLPLKMFLTYCSTFAKYSTGFHEKSNFVQILRIFYITVFSRLFCVCFARIKRNNICALYYASQFSTIFKRNTAKINTAIYLY